jgi:hypothetical protein
MADQAGLKLIGWLLGSITAAVMLIAALLVHDAVANPNAVLAPPMTTIIQ